LAETVQRLSRFGADAAHARMVLNGELTQFVTQQALTLAFNDVFLLMAAIFVAALLIVPFAKTAILGDGPPDGGIAH
jgi:MFS transporter, DHA2 family, multidrug resistance protein